MKNNPKELDTIWEFLYSIFNYPRCKTALLLISIITFSAYAYTEMTQHPSTSLQNAAVIIIGIWAGRMTKKGEANAGNP